MSDLEKNVPAAFINAIAEEGTKAEAVEWLQKTWNDKCALQDEIERLEAAVQKAHDDGIALGQRTALDDMREWTPKYMTKHLSHDANVALWVDNLDAYEKDKLK